MGRRVLIIGAGLSGLAIARLLSNNGTDNVVFEASTLDRSQGFAISLREWAYVPLLEALGDRSTQSMARGVAPDRAVGGSGFVDMIMRDNSNGQVLVQPDPETRPPIQRANRNALRQWMSACGEDELDIRYGHVLSTIEGTPGQMTAVFANGSRHEGSLVIAADGVHSAVRSQILPHVAPEIVPVAVYHGEFCIPRGEFDTVLRPHLLDSNILAGVGDSFNTPITISNITSSHVHLDWSYSRSAEGDADPLYRPTATAEEAKQIPAAFLDELSTRHLAKPWSHYLNVDAIKTHSVIQWTSRSVFITREDAQQSAQHRIVFVGDSWHAMPIFGGEGGNHALLDSVELAELLRNESDWGKAVSDIT